MNYEQRESVGLKYVFAMMEPHSAPGAQRLKRLPLYGPDRLAALSEELDNVDIAVKALEKDSGAFGPINDLLGHIKDIAKTLERAQSEALDEVELFEIKNFIFFVIKINEVYIDAGAPFKGLAFNAPARVYEMLDVGQSGGFYVSDAYSETLKEIRGRKNDLSRRLAICGAQQRDELKLKHLETSAAEQREEWAVCAALSRKLAPYAGDLAADADAVARLDIILCKAELAVRLGAVRPKISDKINLDGAFNPMIADKVERAGRRFTPVTIAAGRGVTVITGANMGGKTVALKTIALNAALLSYGFFVCAARAELPLTHFTEIVADNLQSVERGLSSFGGEIAKVDELLRRSETEPGVILLDEFAGGTNPEEGAKIFRAVAGAFNETDSIVVMTTHFDRVAGVAKAHYRVAGLTNAPWKELKKFRPQSPKEGVELLSRYMDYGLLTATGDEAPRDAVKICYLMGVAERIKDRLD